MILKEDSTEQKLRGAYYTPLKLAEKMVDFFKKDASIKSILEPSCGDGVFVDALVETQFLTQNRKVTAIEIEKNEAQKVAEKLKIIQMYLLRIEIFLSFIKNIRI